MSPQETVQSFIKDFTGLSGKYSPSTLFNDFCTVTMACLHNSPYTLGQKEIPERYKDIVDTVEEEYKKTTQKYDTQVLDKFARIFANLVIAMNSNPYDYLGGIYMMLGVGNASAGQFFTPSHICDLMAMLSADKESIEKQIQSNEPITMHDPACGSGAMAIGFIKMLKKEYAIKDYTSRLYINLIDIDYLCVKMAYIQMALLGVAATVACGDSLTMKIQHEFHTPNLQMSLAQYVPDPMNTPDAPQEKAGQLSLF